MSKPHELREKAVEAFSKGRFGRAAELYSELCKLEPRDRQSQVRLGDAWVRAGKPDLAIAAYRSAAEGFAKDGFLPRAIAATKLILELDPSHTGVQQSLANLYALKGSGGPSGKERPAPAIAEAPPLATEIVAGAGAEFEPAVTEPFRLTVVAPSDFETEITETYVPVSSPEEPTTSPEIEIAPHAATPRFDELELDDGEMAKALEAGLSPLQRVESVAARAGVVAEAEPEPDEPRPVDALPRIPLFSDLSSEAFVALLEQCPLRRYGLGQRVLEQGTMGDSFFVICEGGVRVYKENGPTLAALTEGAFFGEMALLSGDPRAASVATTSEQTQLLEISSRLLASLSEKYPQLAQALKKFCRQRMLSNVIASSPLFAGFSRSDRRALVEKFRAREVPAGATVISIGSRSDGLYVVLSGQLEVSRGNERLAVLRQGDIFGEMSLLQRTPATAQVKAVRRTSLLRLPREELDAIILSHPQLLALISELTEHRQRENEAVLEGAAAVGDEGLMLV